MKIIQALGAVAMLASSTAATYAQSGQTTQRSAGDYAVAASSNELTAGRSVSVKNAPSANCQRNEPSVSANGDPSLSETPICRGATL